MQYALLLCLVLTLLTMAFQWFMFEPGKGGLAPASESSGMNFLAVARSFTPALRELLVSDILIRFCERIPYAFVILWAMNHAGVNAQQFGVLVACEMVTAMICYIPVAHLADKHGRRPFVLVTFLFFTLFPVTLLWANSFGWLALAFVVRGLKEFGEPARKALIIGEAVPGAPRAHLRRLLSDSGLRGDQRLLPGRVAVEPSIRARTSLGPRSAARWERCGSGGSSIAASPLRG